MDPVINVDIPGQMNAYSYAHNDPATNSDPTGECAGPDCPTRRPQLRTRSRIAVRWGPVRASDFTRALRNAYGVSPMEYRVRGPPNRKENDRAGVLGLSGRDDSGPVDGQASSSAEPTRMCRKAVVVHLEPMSGGSPWLNCKM